MKIGIIGAGMVGKAVAVMAIKRGYEVMISNSRGPESLLAASQELNCKVGSPEEAASFGDVVLIAVPLKAYNAIPVQALKGKVVIDAGNYYPERDGHIGELDRGEMTTSELLAHHLPDSRIVKAFSAILATDIAKDAKRAGSPERRAHPISGDDSAAKRVVTDLIEDFGFDVLDVGALTEGYRFQRHTPAYCVPLDMETLKQALANAGAR